LMLCVHISMPIGPTGNIPPIYWCCELKVSNGKRNSILNRPGPILKIVSFLIAPISH
jgi:hypothetical protein